MTARMDTAINRFLTTWEKISEFPSTCHNTTCLTAEREACEIQNIGAPGLFLKIRGEGMDASTIRAVSEDYSLTDIRDAVKVVERHATKAVAWMGHEKCAVAVVELRQMLGGWCASLVDVDEGLEGILKHGRIVEVEEYNEYLVATTMGDLKAGLEKPLFGIGLVIWHCEGVRFREGRGKEQE
jgi:hypothetical protein